MNSVQRSLELIGYELVGVDPTEKTALVLNTDKKHHTMAGAGCQQSFYCVCANV